MEVQQSIRSLLSYNQSISLVTERPTIGASATPIPLMRTAQKIFGSSSFMIGILSLPMAIMPLQR